MDYNSDRHLKRFQLNQRKKANQRHIQYNSIVERVYSTNIVGRIPLIHNIVNILPIVFKRKQSTINMLLHNTTKEKTKETPTNNNRNYQEKNSKHQRI